VAEDRSVRCLRDSEAVARVVAALEDETLIQAVEIESNIQMHAPPFARVAEGLQAVLARINVTAPGSPYVPNVTGMPVANATPEQIKTSLALPRSASRALAGQHRGCHCAVANAHFVEVGPVETLYNQFGRSWTPGRRSKTDKGDDLRKRFEALTDEPCHGV
jgi:acyl transferase domain-containing protein